MTRNEPISSRLNLQSVVITHLLHNVVCTLRRATHYFISSISCLACRTTYCFGTRYHRHLSCCRLTRIYTHCICTVPLTESVYWSLITNAGCFETHQMHLEISCNTGLGNKTTESSYPPRCIPSVPLPSAGSVCSPAPRSPS